MAFLYTNNELYHKEKLGKQSHQFLLRNRYLRINLTMDVKDLSSEKYKTVKKEIEEDTTKWKHIYVHGLEEVISLKCPFYPKQSVESM